MSSAARTLSIFLTIAAVANARAQVITQPTPPPGVTAESEQWYLAGDPITYSGHFYYPTGAHIHFNANEMVRSGFYDGIPLYVRTTLEPFSIVFVPLPGGMMQPYERPRDGELAGTAGSMTPSLPTAAHREGLESIAQAAAPPTLMGSAERPDSRATAAVASVGSPGGEPLATSTSGPGPSRPSRVRVGSTPRGVNAIFIDLGGKRWYSAGAAVAVDPSTMTRVGEHHGFVVFADNTSPSTRIYVQVADGGSTAAPYSTSRTPLQR